MRFPLPLLTLAALVVAGCSSPEKRMEKQMRQASEENSRRAEEMRMRAVASGEAGSERGAQIIQYDPEKVFDPSRSGIGTVRPYGTKKAGSKEFYARDAQVGAFRTSDFAGSKTSANGKKKFATSDANTRGNFRLPSDGTASANKTAATREAKDSQKSAPTRDLVDGRRPYLGPESKKLGVSVEPKDLANWRNGGETTVYTDGVVEKVSTFKQLSIEDVRQLLNKNK